VIVDGKPDQRISDTRRITVVIKEGSVIDRTALRLDHTRAQLQGNRFVDGTRLVRGENGGRGGGIHA